MPLFKGEGDAVITLEGFDAEDIGAAPKFHGHGIDQVTGLQQALEQKQPAGEYQPAGDYAPAIHEHGIENVTGLQEALDSKQPADEDLAAIAQLSTTQFGRSLLERADAQSLRSLLDVAPIIQSQVPPTNPAENLRWIELNANNRFLAEWIWHGGWKRWLSPQVEHYTISLVLTGEDFKNIQIRQLQGVNYDFLLEGFTGSFLCANAQSTTSFWQITLNRVTLANVPFFVSQMRTSDIATTNNWIQKKGYYNQAGDQSPSIGAIAESDTAVFRLRHVPTNNPGTLTTSTTVRWRWVRPQ